MTDHTHYVVYYSIHYKYTLTVTPLPHNLYTIKAVRTLLPSEATRKRAVCKSNEFIVTEEDYARIRTYTNRDAMFVAFVAYVVSNDVLVLAHFEAVEHANM